MRVRESERASEKIKKSKYMKKKHTTTLENISLQTCIHRTSKPSLSLSLVLHVSRICCLLHDHLHVCFVRLHVYNRWRKKGQKNIYLCIHQEQIILERERKLFSREFDVEAEAVDRSVWSYFCSSHPPVFKLYEIWNNGHRDWIPKRQVDQWNRHSRAFRTRLRRSTEAEEEK